MYVALVKMFSILIIGGTILLTLIMLPIYFIRKKKSPNDPKNTFLKLVISAFIAITIMSLLFGSGLIMMYLDDFNW